MKYTRRICAILLVSAMLTACGTDPVSTADSSTADTTTTTETTTSAAETTTVTTTATTTAVTTTTTIAPSADGYSDDDLITLARCYYGSRNNWVPEFIEVDGTEGDDQTVTLHLYDVREYHTTTCNWYYIDRKTGKGTDLTGEAVDLTEPEAELYNPDVMQRNDLSGDVCCAVQFIGNFPMNAGRANGYNAALIEHFLLEGYADEYPFLGKLMNDQHFAETQNAQELWLIIPRDRDARVNVIECDPVEGRIDGAIFRSYNGCPFLLYCNHSEVASDVQIQVTDKKGEHEAFTVSISGMDGSPQVDKDCAVVLEPELQTHYGD